MAPTLLTFEELSNYEQDRTPHELIEDKPIMVHSDAVRREFTCIICLDLLTKTMTSQHCLHRFCYDCITTSLRLGNKECPTCRAKVASKRDLREDPAFDALIETLFPHEVQKHSKQQKTSLTQCIQTSHRFTSSKSTYESIEISNNETTKHTSSEEEILKIEENTKIEKTTPHKQIKNNYSIVQHKPKTEPNRKEEIQVIKCKKVQNDDENKPTNKEDECSSQERKNRGDSTRKSTRIDAINVDNNKKEQKKSGPETNNSKKVTIDSKKTNRECQRQDTNLNYSNKSTASHNTNKKHDVRPKKEDKKQSKTNTSRKLIKNRKK